MNENFFEAYQWWAFSKILETPPYEGGWMDWPYTAVAVISAFNTEQRRMDQEELEKK